MGTAEFIGALLGAYGAGLGTYQGWRSYRDRKPRLHVTMEVAYLATADYGLGPPIVSVRAANVGEKPVHLLRPTMWIEGTPTAFPMLTWEPAEFPYTLAPGQACWVPVQIEFISTQLKKFGIPDAPLTPSGYSAPPVLFGYFADELGRVFKSAPFSFDVGLWCARPTRSVVRRGS